MYYTALCRSPKRPWGLDNINMSRTAKVTTSCQREEKVQTAIDWVKPRIKPPNIGVTNLPIPPMTRATTALSSIGNPT